MINMCRFKKIPICKFFIPNHQTAGCNLPSVQRKSETLKNLFHMEVKHTLVEFLEGQLPSYSNPGGIQLYLNTESSLFIFSDYPGIERPPHINLELFQEFKSLEHFLTALGLSRLDQLLKLTPADLLGLYDRGKLNIVCCLEGKIYREMSSRKYKRKLWARDTHDKMHQLKMPISQPEDFIAYTVRYYQLINN
jgi:hypothetical protein